ncbi:MAG: helix-turn-helix transcriptional regulator [Fulvimarina manganoxydans]|uniref:helix-turn-helix domain-containing protein n=1 Tax=Fulvimarina manganoxydans TaxID=937218 RepID=UPI0023567A99|nr:helix-turn-helix transcriptional regulator [Fulvimarina manganoxydans]MCK5930929.1 helix-turn-helix transcriptional regulator [Fulvimarina manganoxydans]
MEKKNAKSSGAIDQLIGACLKRGRLIAGLSREKLSGQLGISWQQLQKYETGGNRISAGRLFEIARILERPIDFFDGADEHVGTIIDHPTTSETAVLIRELKSLPKKRQMEIVPHLRAVVKAFATK